MHCRDLDIVLESSHVSLDHLAPLSPKVGEMIWDAFQEEVQCKGPPGTWRPLETHSRRKKLKTYLSHG